MKTFARGFAIALGAAVVLCTPPLRAQSPAEYQALKKEIEALRLRQEALQREIDALKSQPASVSAPARAANPAPAVENVVLRLEKAPSRGSETARVVFVELADFECPFCGRYFIQTAPQIKREYVDTGKIRQVFINLPLPSHQYAFKAAEAGACAFDQGKFWEMHDRLFSNQGAALALPRLPGHADAIGLDGAAFRTCLDSGKQASRVRSEAEMSDAAGATATPTFFIGTIDPATRRFKAAKKIVGAKAFQVFKDAIDSLL